MSQSKQFLLPDLGEGLTEGEIVSWLVSVGDAVELDQPVAEVETAKAVVEVPSPFAGTVAALHAEPGDTVEVGKPLMDIALGDAAGAPPDEAEAADLVPEPEAASPAGTDDGGEGSGNVLVGYGTAEGRRRRRRRGAPADGDGEAAATAAPGIVDASGRPLAKPPVRKLAKDLGIDLADVSPSGPGGIITREDVEAFASQQVPVAPAAPADAAPAEEAPPPEAPAPAAMTGISVIDPLGLLREATGRAAPEPGGPELVERRPLRGVRRTIAAHMTRSRAEIPEAVAWVSADATELMELRQELVDANPDVRLSPLALILRACVAGLRRFPEVNSRLDVDTGEIVVQRFVNLGVAAQTDAGLMVPVIRGADRMSTLEIAAELNRLAAGARERTLTPAELSGSTFTVSNYGSFGLDGGDMVINHPEAAILGVGRIADRPWVVDGAVTPRKVVDLSVAFDHRICDGGDAGGFLRFVADCVESPTRLLAAL